MASSDGELEEQLLQAGNKLVDPPSSVDELLSLLDVKALIFCSNFVTSLGFFFIIHFLFVSCFLFRGCDFLVSLLKWVCHIEGFGGFCDLCCMLCSCLFFYGFLFSSFLFGLYY